MSEIKRRRLWPFILVIAASALVTFGLTALLMNVAQRKREGREQYFKLAELTEDTVDPAVWGRDFPRQYDGYLRTADNEPAAYGSGDGLAASKLETDPRLKRIYAGYAFSIDYREKRGHAFMLSDQEQTERVHKVKQPGACLHCHTSVLPLYRELGKGDVEAGFVKACAMPYQEAHDLKDAKGEKLVKHPVACIDCHDPATM